MMVLSETGAVC